MKINLNSDERIDQLYTDDIKIIQSSEVFSFSIDAVLLANFPKIPKKGLLVDLCAGNGAVGLFVSKKTNAKIVSIELQERLADMAKRSVELNMLSDQFTIINDDLKNSTRYIKKDSADLILCNPPYFKEETLGKKNPNPYLAIARHEITTNLDEVINISSQLLKTNGRLAMVHRPDRLLDILNTMQAHNIAPKRLQFVYPKQKREANTILIEGIKHGKLDGLKILPPIYIHKDNNEYTQTLRGMLYGE